MKTMRGFTTGLVTGGLLGAACISYALSDRRVRKRIVRDARHAAEKASDVISNISDVF